MQLKMIDLIIFIFLFLVKISITKTVKTLIVKKHDTLIT